MLLEDDVKKVQYYVGSLMPPLEPCRVVTESKLRRMSEIPGRGNTTVLLQGKSVSVWLIISAPAQVHYCDQAFSVGHLSIINFSHFRILKPLNRIPQN